MGWWRTRTWCPVCALGMTGEIPLTVIWEASEGVGERFVRTVGYR